MLRKQSGVVDIQISIAVQNQHSRFLHMLKSQAYGAPGAQRDFLDHIVERNSAISRSKVVIDCISQMSD